MKHKLLIIGGGASGIIAAISAADRGIDVAIVEGGDRIAKKLLTTGNGRCNITNKYIEENRYHSENPSFFKKSIEAFTVQNTISFFESLGLPLTTLEEGKMYPMSLQASSVLDILRLSLEEKNIPLYLNEKIKSIKSEKGNFKLTTNNGDVFECEKLLLACGGKSSPKTGSDGSGFALAKTLGHTLVSPIPAIVQLKLNYKHLKGLSGIKFNGFVEIFADGISKRKEFGEVLFTDYGISGPPVLQVSRIASYWLSKGKDVTLVVNMLYTFTRDELEDFFESHWAIFSHRSVHDSFIGIINKKMISIFLKECGISEIHKACLDLSWKEKKGIYELLQNWKFSVTDTNSFENAQVTAGGINTLEVNADTLESKLVPNLYFAGEILDVDGDCGGFNLQWAWSSGFLSGEAASR